MYDADVLSEEALLEWAEQKEQDEEEDQVYFKKVRETEAGPGEGSREGYWHWQGRGKVEQMRA